MDQVGSWVAYLATVIFGLLAWVMDYWSLSTVLVIVAVLIAIGIVVERFLQPPRSA